MQEIVDEILSKMESEELDTPRIPFHLVAPAFVNRTWFFSSLPILWKDVTLMKALKLLGDMSGILPNAYSFIQPPTLAQWDRFLIYSKYVRTLTGREYDVHTLATAASSRPNDLQFLFPNLISLKWKLELAGGKYLIERFPAADITVLISPNLEIFSLDLKELPLPFFWFLCYTLITRIQALRILQICLRRTPEEANGCLDPFNQVLQSFKKTLIHVWMPENFHTKEIMEELGRFPNLSELVIGTPLKVMYDEHSDWYPGFNEEVEEEFQNLSDLSFSGSQHALCDRFLSNRKFSSLTDVIWNLCMVIPDPESFVTTIAEACPELYKLSVGKPDAYENEDHLPPIIPWRTIRILLRCGKLAALSLHCCRVSMIPEDWIELLSSGTAWEIIQIYSVTPLRITDLPVFARYCPLLMVLGIYVDVRAIDDDIRVPNDTPLPPSIISPNVAQALAQRESIEFLMLCNVNFGYSPYYPRLAPKIASFIMEMCKSSKVKQPLVAGWYWPWEEFNTHMSNADI